MFRTLLLTSSILLMLFCQAQADSLVVKDLKLILFYNNGESLEPVTNEADVAQVSFHITSADDQYLLRVCNDSPVYLWREDQLIRKIDGCATLRIPEVRRADTTYFTLSALSHFSGLKCELITLTEAKTVLEALPKFRSSDFMNRYISVSSFILLCLFAFFRATNRSRLALSFSRSFTLKTSLADQEYNMYKDQSVIQFILLNSVLVSSLYPLLMPETLEQSLISNLLNWMYYSFVVFLFFSSKQILILFLSNVHGVKEFSRRQIIDYLNLSIPIFILIWIYLIFLNSSDSDSGNLFPSLFNILVVIGFLLIPLFLSAKLLVNSYLKKISIISYLCATELIPVAFLLTWFFK